MFVVFDLDGTIALNDHRIHLIDRSRPEGPDWDAFYAACVDDEPCWTVIQTMRAHLLVGHRARIWSGRSAQVEKETVEWLGKHIPSITLPPTPGFRAPISGGTINAVDLLERMRPVGDVRPDVVLKREWLDEERARGTPPDLVYDDRDRLVAMWREEGVPCFQVAPGDF